VANRIYATDEVVLRIATDHPDAIADARTESVAAPVARAAGVKTPRLLAFDDSRLLIDRPYSLWERVHGETLGLLPTKLRLAQHTWEAVGEELALLHLAVQTCPDPNGWLDQQIPEDPVEHLRRWRLQGPARRLVARVERRLHDLSTAPPEDVAVRFVHGDIHDMNVMCAKSGQLLALIDWGDAGWGDPALDFVDVPLAVLDTVVTAYERRAGPILGLDARLRILRDRFGRTLRRVCLGRDGSLPALEELLRFAEGWPRT